MVKFKFIEHENTTDAPFVGALICANGCSLKCKGCNAKEYKKMDTKELSVKSIIEDVLAHKENKGIILSGLEWSDQPEEMLELGQMAHRNGLQVMIYTGLELGEFNEKLGKYFTTNLVDKLEPELVDFLQLDTEKQLFNQTLGATMLDYYINGDFFLKTGAYDKTLAIEDRTPFGVKLSSENQKLLLITE